MAILARREPSPCPIFLNGQAIGSDDVALLTPGDHFIFSSAGPRAWLAVSIPIVVVREHCKSSGRAEAEFLQWRPTPILGGAERIHRILYKAEELRLAAAESLDRVQDPQTEEIERTLIDYCIESVAGPRYEQTSKSSALHFDALELVSAALRAVSREDESVLRVDSLCRAIGVSSRTLLRAFHRIVDMGPTRYLRLRQLNMIRRDLRQAGPMGASVTEVLVAHNVTELGRIAGQYKALFGEPPSQTLRQAAAGVQ